MIVLLAEAAHNHPTWADFGPTEWICVVLAGAVGVWAVWKAVMYTLEPGEEEPDHIKRAILDDPLSLETSLSLQGDAEDEVTAR